MKQKETTGTTHLLTVAAEGSSGLHNVRVLNSVNTQAVLAAELSEGQVTIHTYKHLEADTDRRGYKHTYKKI